MADYAVGVDNIDICPGDSYGLGNHLSCLDFHHLERDCSKCDAKENVLMNQIQVSLKCHSTFVLVCFSHNPGNFYHLRSDRLGCHSLYKTNAKQLGENLWRNFSPYKSP